MDVTDIVRFALVVLAAIWTYFLVPWLRTKKTADERKALAENIKTAVKAAEQIYTQSGKGHEKKAYVLQWLREQGIKIDDVAIIELVDALIESSVLELKRDAAALPIAQFGTISTDDACAALAGNTTSASTKEG